MDAPQPRAPDPTSDDWRAAFEFELIWEAMDLAASHALCAREGAYRQSRVETQYHLAAVRRCLVEAIESLQRIA